MHLILPDISIPSSSTGTKKKKEEVLDSWDDAVSSGDEGNDEANDIVTDMRLPPAHSPAPPPAPPAPTPFSADGSPTVGSYYSYDPETHSRAGNAAGSDGPRQAKTDAVARRMIASALGVRSRSTQEQKEYEASLKLKMKEEKEERKKVEAEKEKAKAAVWDD